MSFSKILNWRNRCNKIVLNMYHLSQSTGLFSIMYEYYIVRFSYKLLKRYFIIIMKVIDFRFLAKQ